MKQVRAAEPDRIVHLMLLNELTLGSQAAWLHATIGKAYLYRIGLELLQSDGKLGTNRFRQQISEDDLSRGVNSCQIPSQRSMYSYLQVKIRRQTLLIGDHARKTALGIPGTLVAMSVQLFLPHHQLVSLTLCVHC